MTQTGLKRLSGRMRDKQGKAELSAIQQSFTDLKATALGSAGLFAAQAVVLKARADLAAGGEALDRIERTYLGILDGVVQAVGNLNGMRGATPVRSLRPVDRSLAPPSCWRLSPRLHWAGSLQTGSPNH